MAECQIKPASLFAFPRGSASVEDRKMSLETNCREPATYSAKLRSAAPGRERKAAPVREFLLCENHVQLVEQVNGELLDEGWSTALSERARFLA